MEESDQLYLADVFEAFIGALYLDKGIETVYTIFEKNVFPKVMQVLFLM